MSLNQFAVISAADVTIMDTSANLGVPALPDRSTGYSDSRGRRPQSAVNEPAGSADTAPAERRGGGEEHGTRAEQARVEPFGRRAKEWLDTGVGCSPR
jgi:hypothetical protein